MYGVADMTMYESMIARSINQHQKDVMHIVHDQISILCLNVFEVFVMYVLYIIRGLDFNISFQNP